MKIEFDLKLNSQSPVYSQIVNYYMVGVVSGAISDMDELPSRRDLAISLAINPNTAQKAYAILEEEGLIMTYNNSKSCAKVDEEIRVKLKQEMEDLVFDRFISCVTELGLSREEAHSIIDRRWGND